MNNDASKLVISPILVTYIVTIKKNNAHGKFAWGIKYLYTKFFFFDIYALYKNQN